MRLGIVLAATGAAAVTAWAVAAAQDGLDGTGYRPTVDPASRRTIHYFSRTGSASQQTVPNAAPQPKSVPGVKNYYGTLFSQPAPPAQDRSPVQQTAGNADEDASLIHARFERQNNGAPAGEIRQVGSQQGLPATAAPSQTAFAAPQQQADPFAAFERRPQTPVGAAPQMPAQPATAPVQTEAPYMRQALHENRPGSRFVPTTQQISDDQFEPAPGLAAPSLGEPIQSAPSLGAPSPAAPSLGEPMQSAPSLGAPSLGAPSMGAPSLGSAPSLDAPEMTVPAQAAPTMQVETRRAAPSTGMPIPTEVTPRGAVPRSQTIPTTPSGISQTSGEAPAQRLAEAYMGGPAAVEVHWERVDEITVGQECRCELVVKNCGASAAGDVAVEAFFPRSVRLTNADPAPTAKEDHLTWMVPSLSAGEERRIAISLIPNQQGDLQIAAYVRYTEAAATTIAVREPQLQVALSGVEEVAMGEMVTQTITVSNPGSGTADNVRVEVLLPPGLEHAKGSNLAMPLGSLASGQSQTIRLSLFATKGGPQSIEVKATAGQTLRHEASCQVMVSAPTLAVIAEGPGLRYVGRDAQYRIRVTNDGRAAASNVRVTHHVPDGFTFVRADKNGQFSSGSHEIVWYLAQVEAGQSIDLAAELTASGVGPQQHKITVIGEGGATAETSVDTNVDGTASLVVEVLDLDDPVEVGAETAYEVRVRNEGTKSATNVEVVCQVPNGVAALSARGPTDHQGEASMLTFAPIAQLEPGKAALYRVVVKGQTPGRHRFRVRLTSDSIDEPLVHEELTHYYAD